MSRFVVEKEVCFILWGFSNYHSDCRGLPASTCVPKRFSSARRVRGNACVSWDNWLYCLIVWQRLNGRRKRRERIENNLVINDIERTLMSALTSIRLYSRSWRKISSINTIISPSWQRRTKNEVCFYQKANQEKREEAQQKKRNRNRKREKKQRSEEKDENLSLFVLFPNNSEMETGTMMMIMTKKKREGGKAILPTRMKSFLSFFPCFFS